MKVIRSLGALLTLLVIIVGAPLVLTTVGADLVPSGWGWQQLRDLLLTPDTTGRVFVAILTIVGWVAWALFTLCVLVELINTLGGTRIRLPGLGVGQKLAGGLVAAVFTITTLTTTSPAAAAPTHTGTTPAVVTTNVAAIATKTPTKATPTKAEKVHVVEAGDYLWKIAEEHYGDGAQFRRIAKANNIDPFKDLAVGQKLTLPGIPATPPTTTPEATPDVTADIPAGLPATVVVGPADSLWGYAVTYLGDGERWPEIWALNKDLVKDPDLLLDGWTLKMPVPDQPTTVDKTTTQDSDQDTQTPDTELEQDTEVEQPPPPTTTTPTTAPATTVPAQQEVPAAETPADGDEVPLAALAGVGLILTAGLVSTLNRRRRRQLQRRGRGQRISMPSEDAQRVETALRQQPTALTVAELDLVLRVIGHHAAATATELPRVSAVRLAHERIDILLAAPLPDAPAGVEVVTDGSVWTIHEHALDKFTDLRESLTDSNAPYPALATLGHDDDGADILVDLEAAGALTITADDEDLSNALMRGMALDLAVAPWSDALNLTLVGDVCPGLEQALADPTVTRVSDITELLSSLEARAAEQRQAIGAGSVGQKRLDPDTWDAVDPEIVLLNQRLDPDVAQRLARVITDLPRAAVATITTAPLDEATDTQWRYRLAGDPLVGRLQPHDWRLQPQTVTEDDYRHICELLATSTATTTRPAPWWDHNPLPTNDLDEPDHTNLDQGNPDPDEVDVEQLADITHLPTRDHSDTAAADEPTTHDNANNSSVDEEAALRAGGAGKRERRRNRAPLSLAPLIGDTDIRALYLDDTDTPTTAPARVGQKPAATQPASAPRAFELTAPPAPEPLVDPATITTPQTTSPVLRILGPVELVGAGGEPGHAPTTCQEILLFLLDHPAATTKTLADRLYIALTAVRSRVSNLRAWLGEDLDGEPYLPKGGRDGYRLHPGVTSDWHQLQALVAGGVNHTPTVDLVAALTLVRGAPFEDVAHAAFAFAENTRVAISSTIVDTALVLTDRALDAGDIRLARWAAAQALMVDPGSEQLLNARIRTEYQAGNMTGAHTLIGQVKDNARALDVDLLSETITTIQQVATGQKATTGLEVATG